MTAIIIALIVNALLIGGAVLYLRWRKKKGKAGILLSTGVWAICSVFVLVTSIVAASTIPDVRSFVIMAEMNQRRPFSVIFQADPSLRDRVQQKVQEDAASGLNPEQITQSVNEMVMTHLDGKIQNAPNASVIAMARILIEGMEKAASTSADDCLAIYRRDGRALLRYVDQARLDEWLTAVIRAESGAASPAPATLPDITEATMRLSGLTPERFAAVSRPDSPAADRCAAALGQIKAAVALPEEQAAAILKDLPPVGQPEAQEEGDTGR